MGERDTSRAGRPRRWVGPLMSGLAALVWLAQPSCSGLASMCTVDADCGPEEACVEQICRTRCASNEDCAEEDELEPGAQITCRPITRPEEPDEAINVCAPPETDSPEENNDSPQACQSNAECVERLGEMRARCSVVNTCILAPDEHSVLIRDAGSPGPADAEAGVELLALWVEDDTGARLGWGVLEAYEPAGGQDPSPPMGALDGSPVELDPEATCVADPAQAPALRLGGAGGTARVSFLDAQGRRLLLEEGWQIVVLERGPDCHEDEVADEYEVSLCVSQADGAFEEQTQCEPMAGSPGSGLTRLEVSLPRAERLALGARE